MDRGRKMSIWKRKLTIFMSMYVHMCAMASFFILRDVCFPPQILSFLNR